MFTSDAAGTPRTRVFGPDISRAWLPGHRDGGPHPRLRRTGRGRKPHPAGRRQPGPSGCCLPRPCTRQREPGRCGPPGGAATAVKGGDAVPGDPGPEPAPGRQRRPGNARRAASPAPGRPRLMPAPPEVPAVSLISQPGSDYQLTEITPHLGRARDITHLLTGIHGLLSELYLNMPMSSPRSPRLSRTVCATATALRTPSPRRRRGHHPGHPRDPAVLHISPTASQPGPLPF